jgi:hypothetical protein
MRAFTTRRLAEFGFLGEIVNTRKQIAFFCGLPLSLRLLDFFFLFYTRSARNLIKCRHHNKNIAQLDSNQHTQFGRLTIYQLIYMQLNHVNITY